LKGILKKIPFRINELSYLVEKSGSSNIIIVCDLEKLPCFLDRKTKIENVVKERIDVSHMHYAFFKPMIESGYWECATIIEKVIALDFKERFAKPTPNPLVLEINNHPLDSLKKSFKKYNLKYRELSQNLTVSDLHISWHYFKKNSRKNINRVISLNFFLQNQPYIQAGWYRIYRLAITM
jgi:hypothetical protein